MFGHPRYQIAAAPRRYLLRGELAYNQPSRQLANGRRTVFLPGAFRQCTGKVPLAINHLEVTALGLCQVSETPDALVFEFLLDPQKSQHARLISDQQRDALTGFSPTFSAVGRLSGDCEYISTVDALREISVVRRPAMPVCFTELSLTKE